MSPPSASSEPHRRWAGRAQWRILQSEFGCGHAFLSAWRAWQADADRPGLLHFVAFCSQAPAPHDLGAGLAAATWTAEQVEQLRQQWWGLVAGVHRLAFENGRVLLTLGVGPADRLLAQQDFAADTVLLEAASVRGDDLSALKPLARCSRVGTRLQSTCSSPALAKKLAEVGFVLDSGLAEWAQAAPLQGVFQPHWSPRHVPRESAHPARVAVIGAGLAGAAVAASLARRGWQVEVLDAAAEPAAGASGLPAGLLAPHSTPDDNLLSRLSRSGVRITLQQAHALLRRGKDWEPTGVMEERGGDARVLASLGPGEEAWQRPAGRDAAAIWHAAGAWIKPAALVRAWLDHPAIRWLPGARVHRLERAHDGWSVLDEAGAVLSQAQLVVVAAAHASAALLPRRMALHPVRGQVSWGPVPPGTTLAAAPVNGNGHFLPNVPTPEGAVWLSGSTYVRADTSLVARAHEDAANLERLRVLQPQAARVLEADFTSGRVQSWVGVRCTASDRRPLVGELAPGLWISTAMGSRGLAFAALCAELMAARLHGEPLPLERRQAEALAAERSTP